MSEHEPAGGSIATAATSGESAITRLFPRLAQADFRAALKSYVVLSLQLGLVLLLGVRSAIELERGFAVVAWVTFAGFAIHYWLPAKHRLPFFLVLTAVAIGLLLGADGLWLVGLGLGLIGICHLPLPWLARLGLVLAACGGLVALRAGWVDAPWDSIVLPLCASLFMFRLVLYLYDLRGDATPATVWQRLGYFFMLPNLAAPLFPVVDYRTFLRGSSGKTDVALYQRGIFWMMRGILQLMLYRVVYHLLPVAEADLGGAFGVYVVMAMTFGLYLRLSGIFHLVTGVLCVFGFDVPPTHKQYFLATSFSDLWRRVNIYWTSFMQTMVFYPVFVSLRRFGIDLRLVLATAAVVIVTWFLHAYQWFWLQGEFLLAGTDVLFWGILGAALIANTVWEARRGKKKPSAAAWSWRAGLAKSARTLGFFSLMAVLWSMWQSESFAEWLALLGRVGDSRAADWLALGLLFAAVLAAGVGMSWLGARGWSFARLEAAGLARAPVLVPLAAAALMLIALPQVKRVLGRDATAAIVLVTTDMPNSVDRDKHERGYYETLTRSTKIGRHVQADPEGWVGLAESEFVRPTEDMRRYELVPGMSGIFKGDRFTVNRWGMRDRDYSLEKPPGTYRIAIVGASIEMGSGVSNDDVFDNPLEDRMSREWAGGGRRYEVLNQAVGGYDPLGILASVEEVVPRFAPDVVLWFAHPGDAFRTRSALVELGRTRRFGDFEPQHRELADALRRVNASPDEEDSEIVRRLRPHTDRLLRWLYRRGATVIRERGATPVFVLMPETDKTFSEDTRALIEEVAAESGAAVVSLLDVYGGHELDVVRVASWDNHPNPFGHQLVARRLFDELAAIVPKLVSRSR